jgi:hypothetical protein
MGAGAAGTAGVAVSGQAAGPQQHHEKIANIVQPIEGVGNFFPYPSMADEEDEKKAKILSKETVEILQSFNEHFISWSPWDPARLTRNAHLARDGYFAADVHGIKPADKAAHLMTLSAADRDRELRALTPDQLQMVSAPRATLDASPWPAEHTAPLDARPWPAAPTAPLDAPPAAPTAPLDAPPWPAKHTDAPPWRAEHTAPPAPHAPRGLGVGMGATRWAEGRG